MPSSVVGIGFDSSVWQDGITEESFFKTNSDIASTSHVDIGQLTKIKPGINQVGSNQVNTSQSSSTQVSPFQVGSTQIDIYQDGINHIKTTQVSTAQINTIQNSALRKFSLPSSVTSEQFLRSNNSDGVIGNTSIGHGGIAEEHVFQRDYSTQVSTTEVGLNQLLLTFPKDSTQVIIPEVELNQPLLTSQKDSTQVSPHEVGINQNRLTQASSVQRCSRQIGSSQIGTPQVGITQIGSTQIGVSQISTKQRSFPQVSTAQIDPNQIGISQVSFPQVNPSKILLSSLVASEKLFNASHNSPPSSLYTLNNSAQTLWNTLPAPQTPFNINLQIKDLPAGQLAEAVITKYDSSGRTSGGVVLQKLFKESPTHYTQTSCAAAICGLIS
jgi:hypothetical protein